MKNSIINRMNVRAGLIMAMMASFLFLPTFEAEATHIVGGEISYDMVGFERVSLKLVVRRDCALGDVEADYDNPAYLGVFDLDGNPVLNPSYGFINGRIELALNPADTLDEPLLSECLDSNELVCVQEATYRLTRNITPHPSGGYIIAYQRCCRNLSLTNVLNPLGTGMTIVTTITNEAITTRNRVPEFKAFPPIYTCIGFQFDYDQGAVGGVTVDADGDEIRYRLNTPNIGATMANPYPSNPSPPPYNPVTWESGFTLGSLLGVTAPLTIDPTTGVISATPDAEGQYLVSVCMEEVRNGRLFNTTCREFELNTRPCGEAAIAVITPDDVTICDDLSVDFSSAGSQGDMFEWNFGDEATSMLENPTHVYDTAGCYTVTLTVTKTATGCMDTDSTVICLYDSGVDENDFGIEMLECADTIVVKVTDQNAYDVDNPVVEIDWTVTDANGGSIASDSGSMITFGLDQNTVVTICQNIVTANGCEIENCQTADLKLLELDFERDEVLCLDEESMITVFHAQMDDITVVWETNPIIVVPIADPGTSIKVLTPDSIVTTLHFTATNEYGCSVSDSINVTTAGKRPAVSFYVKQDCGSLTIEFVNTSPDTTVEFLWDYGDTNGSTDANPDPHTYGMAGTYTITLTAGTFPCDSSYSVTVEIPIIDIELPDTLYQCFEDSLTLNPGGNADWEYVWSPASLFSNVNATSPKVLVTEVTTVYVMITVYSDSNFCVHKDSIVIVPVPDFQFDVMPDPTNGDITVCGEDSTIQMTVQTMDGVVVTWKDANGNVLHEGDTFNVTLMEGMNNFSVMGVYMGIDECMKSETINIIWNKLNLSFDIINIEDGTDMFCDTAEGKLIAIVDGPPGNYTYEWAPADGVLTGLDNDSLCIMVTENITYCVTVTNTDLDCSVEGCYTINFGAEITLTLLNEGDICVGDTVKVSADIAPAGLDCNIDWAVPGTVVGPDDQLTVCYIATGSGMVTANVGCVGGCMDDASIQVDVRVLSPEILVEVTPVISDDQVVNLDVTNGQSGWTYLWDGPAISDVNIKNPTSQPGRGDHKYSVMVTDEFGCEGMAMTRTGPPPPTECEFPFVFVPNAFSPDGDGLNETLDVFGVEIMVIDEFIIYNRWGQEVYKVNAVPNASWNGEFNGEPLATDVYGYYLRVHCVNGEENIQQGNISLLR